MQAANTCSCTVGWLEHPCHMSGCKFPMVASASIAAAAAVAKPYMPSMPQSTQSKVCDWPNLVYASRLLKSGQLTNY